MRVAESPNPELTYIGHGEMVHGALDGVPAPQREMHLGSTHRFSLWKPSPSGFGSQGLGRLEILYRDIYIITVTLNKQKVKSRRVKK